MQRITRHSVQTISLCSAWTMAQLSKRPPSRTLVRLAAEVGLCSTLSSLNCNPPKKCAELADDVATRFHFLSLGFLAAALLPEELHICKEFSRCPVLASSSLSDVFSVLSLIRGYAKVNHGQNAAGARCRYSF